MSYVPNNPDLFVAVYAAVISGMGLYPIQNPAETYTEYPPVAAAFAQEMDTLYGSSAPSTLELEQLQLICQAVWQGTPPTPNSQTQNASLYARKCIQIINILSASAAYYIAQGITPPMPGGGGSGVVTGEFTFDMQNADYTLLPSEAAHFFLTNGSATPQTAVRTVHLPAASADTAYFRHITNANGSGFDLLVDTPSNGFVAIPDAASGFVGVDATGCFFLDGALLYTGTGGFASGGATGTAVTNQATGVSSVAMGAGCQAIDAGAIAMGSACVATSPAAVALGESCQANEEAAVAVGNHCEANAFGAFASGDSGIATRPAERVHGLFSQPLLVEHDLGLTVFSDTGSGVAVDLVDEDGNELTFTPGAQIIKMHLSATVQCQGGLGQPFCGFWGWDILAHLTNDEVLVIDKMTARAGETFITGDPGPAWTVVPSAVANKLKITYTPDAGLTQSTNCTAVARWDQTQGFGGA